MKTQWKEGTTLGTKIDYTLGYQDCLADLMAYMGEVKDGAGSYPTSEEINKFFLIHANKEIAKLLTEFDKELNHA